MSNPGTTYLRAYWSLDELTGNRYDTVLGDPWLTLYTVGTRPPVGYTFPAKRQTNAADFKASDASGLFTYDWNSFVKFGHPYSACFGLWIRPHTVAPAKQVLLSRWNYGDFQTSQYQIYLAGNRVGFKISNWFGQYIVFANTFGDINPNQWYFVGCDFIYGYALGQSKMRVGVNDVWDEIETDGYAINPGGDAELTFGHYSYLNTGYDQPYDGFMDEVFIFKRTGGLYSELLSAENWTWLYWYSYGRVYNDLVPVLPSIPEIDTEKRGGDLPVYSFDASLNKVGVIEDYYSLIWTERHDEAGDFEIDLPIVYTIKPDINNATFLWIETSNTIMLIEDIKLQTEGDRTSVLVSGRSAEIILNSRVIKIPFTIGGPAQLSMYNFVRGHVSNPTQTSRVIDIFSSEVPGIDSDILYYDQLDRQTVYDAIKLIANNTGLGFRVYCEDLDAANPKLHFYVYEGVDRSTGQIDRPWVLFSDDFDNIITSSILISEKDVVNAVLVITDDLDPDLQSNFVWADGNDYEGGPNEPSGLNRKEDVLEVSIDRDSDGDDIDDLTNQDVLNIISAKGRDIIQQGGPFKIFDGDFDVRGSFVYGKDYVMGDIVQVDIHGISTKARVIELMRSYSVEGETTFISFNFLT